MSQPTIRKALEKRLALLAPSVATAFENEPFTPVTGTMYQRVNLMPNTPDNSTQGAAVYLERGIFQVTVCAMTGTGPAIAEAQAQAIRTHFKRGISMSEGGVQVTVTDTPRIAPALIDGDRYCIPGSVPYQAWIRT